MDFEYESAYRADSPLSYDVEEGELSSGSGRSSPGTVRDNASTCSTQTDDRITTMRVEIDGDTNDQQTQTSLQPTPKEIAQMIKEKVTHKRLQVKITIRKRFRIEHRTIRMNKELVHTYIVINILDLVTMVIKTYKRYTNRKQSFNRHHFLTILHQCDHPLLQIVYMNEQYIKINSLHLINLLYDHII